MKWFLVTWVSNFNSLLEKEIALVSARQGLSAGDLALLLGDFIGYLTDGRARYRVKPGNLRVEAGAPYFVNERLADEAPNASGEGNTAYWYVQAVITF